MRYQDFPDLLLGISESGEKFELGEAGLAGKNNCATDPSTIRTPQSVLTIVRIVIFNDWVRGRRCFFVERNFDAGAV